MYLLESGAKMAKRSAQIMCLDYVKLSLTLLSVTQVSYLWQGDGQLPLEGLLLVAQLSQA